MVEHVIGVEPELGLDALREREVLRQRHVVKEGMRSAVGIESNVSDLAAGRSLNGPDVGRAVWQESLVPERLIGESGISGRFWLSVGSEVYQKVPLAVCVIPVFSLPTPWSGRQGPASEIWPQF